MVAPLVIGGIAAAAGGLSALGLQSLFGGQTKKEAVTQSPASSQMSNTVIHPYAYYSPSYSTVDASVRTFAPQYGYSSSIIMGSPGATVSQPMDYRSQIDAQSRPVIDYIPTSSFGLTQPQSANLPTVNSPTSFDSTSLLIIAALGLGAVVLLKK